MKLLRQQLIHSSVKDLVVHNRETLEIFVKYAISQLGELLERTMKDTKTHIMCILEAFVACYSLEEIGVATRFMNGKYDFCLFYALTFYLHPEHMSNAQREALAFTYWCILEEIDEHLSQKEKHKLAKEYPGINFADINKINRFMTLFDVNIQTYVNEGKSVVIGEFFDHPTESELKAGTLHLYLIGKNHCEFVSDPYKLTKCKSCPKCNHYWQDVSDKSEAAQFREHVATCNGKAKEKQLKLKDSFEYAPHFQKNFAYKYMKAHSTDQYYRPLKGFATFDFETV
jgi:hypothetical protein